MTAITFIFQNKVVKNYLIISAYGMVLLFTANQSVSLTLIPYPPFGLVAISFLGLSAYLVFKGIYSASLSVTLGVLGIQRHLFCIFISYSGQQITKHDKKDEMKFLNHMGTSEMERTIEKGCTNHDGKTTR